MEQVPLTASKRIVLGRKVKSLRRDGIIPAHIFGHKVKTVHVQVQKKDFEPVFEKAGETGIIDLALDKEKRPVMVRNIQVDPLTSDPLHIDFYQVNLSEKVKVNVPLETVGESPAVEKKVGLLLTPVSEIEIEALPTDIPENVEIDISKLENIGDEIKVKDLPIDKSKVEVLTDEELVVVQIGELVTKEMEATEAEIEAEAAAEATEGEEAQAEEGKEGEEKKEAAGEEPESTEEKPQESGLDQQEAKEEKPQE